MNTLEPQTDSGRSKLVVFVPLAKTFVKVVSAVQFVGGSPQEYSGTGCQPVVPVEATTTALPTLMETMAHDWRRGRINDVERALHGAMVLAV